MSGKNDADQADPGFQFAAGIGFAVVGLIAAVVFGLLALTGPELQFGFFVAFLFGYLFASAGVTFVVQHLVDRRLVSAGICGAAAVALALLIMVRRDDLEVEGLLVGAIAVATVGWWAYRSFSGHLKHGR